MKTLSLLGRCYLFGGGGMWGVQIPGWQIDLRDHRLSPPLFSARELGHYCGRHFGNYCLRTGRTR